VKPALLYRAGGKGKEFCVSAGTNADSEKSDLHIPFLSISRDSAGILLGQGFLATRI
jgi:hypothetical protein